jgi:lysophospholipase L1-like esterase
VPFGGLSRHRQESLGVGDSYTLGTSVDPDGRWVPGLAEGLRGDGLVVADLAVIAQTGGATEDLVAGIGIESVE